MSMKKMFIMLVLTFVAMMTKAQIVIDATPSYIILNNGYKYWSSDIPCRLQVGDNVAVKMQRELQLIRAQKGVEEYNRVLMRYQMAKPIEVVDVTAYTGGGVMMGGMVGGVGMVGMGVGIANTGMVGGSMGMAGATSNVVIDNSNLAETVGSGIMMSYDTGSNSLSVSGDPITAGLRLISALGGSKKKARQQAATKVVYVDATTGQVVGQASGATRATTTARTATTNSRSTGNGFVTGY